jgi:hypothetical protein
VRAKYYRLSDIIVHGTRGEAPFEGHYVQGGEWEWFQFDTDPNSGSYGDVVPVEPPDQAVCEAIDERMALNHCDEHPYTGPNGCGADDFVGWLIPEFIPNTMVRASGACDNHDRCYSSVGAVRSQCDDQIEVDIRGACAASAQGFFYQCGQSSGSTQSAVCRERKMDECNAGALGYHAGVMGYGHQAFAAAQLTAVCGELQALKNESGCP